MRRIRLLVSGAAIVLMALLGTACSPEVTDGDEDATGDEDTGAAEAGDVGTITVGSANFAEQLILGNMYAIALEEAGFDVEANLNLGSREVYFPALESGELDVMPEYLGAAYGFLAEEEEEVLTEVDELRSALEEVLPEGLVLLESSEAQDQDALAVTQETADEYGLATVSDLAPVAGELVAGGPPEEETRSVGLPGLREVYDIEFADFIVTDAGGPQTVEALSSGRIDVGRVFTTSSFIDEEGFVVLEEDRDLIPGENITPIVRSEVAVAEVEEVLNGISAALTTDILIDLNARVELDNDDPDVVARDFLVEQGLIEG
ncbi:MAG: hypothetical protein GEU78_17820 [Actinobacteria bacterium]|nr:hypothetical protein [Actinomycetota bacterium]